MCWSGGIKGGANTRVIRLIGKRGEICAGTDLDVLVQCFHNLIIMNRYCVGDRLSLRGSGGGYNR